MFESTKQKLYTLKGELDNLRAQFEDMASQLNDEAGKSEDTSECYDEEVSDKCTDIAAELESMWDELEELLTTDDTPDPRED